MGKVDRVLGAFCVAFAAFFIVAARAIEPSQGALGSTASTITLALALLAAVPGIWLLVKGRSV